MIEIKIRYKNKPSKTIVRNQLKGEDYIDLLDDHIKDFFISGIFQKFEQVEDAVIFLNNIRQFLPGWEITKPFHQIPGGPITMLREGEVIRTRNINRHTFGPHFDPNDPTI